MNLYADTVQLIAQLPAINQWPALQAQLYRLAQLQPLHWRLPVVTCTAVGGTAADGIPAMAAIAALHTSLALVDDMLDTDPKGEYHVLGEATTANLALALQAIGMTALATCKQPPDRLAAMLWAYAQVAATTALGQQWDVQGVDNEAQYWAVVKNKGGPFFGLTFALGAWVGGGSTALVAQFQTLGNLYGTLIQLHDDLSDSMAVPASPDWLPGRATLPILYAQLVPHSDQQAFMNARSALPAPAALVEAQTILLRSGAVSYTIAQILHRYQEAHQLLQQISMANGQPVAALFADIVKPVEELLTLAGVDATAVELIMHQPQWHDLMGEGDQAVGLW